MKKTARETAAETYATRQREIAAMLEFLKCELEVHAEKAAEDPRNWGFAGDLGLVRQNLKETLVFLTGGRDEEAAGEMIESAIVDAMA